MKRVYLELREFPTMRHIIKTDRNMHIINTAARETNIYHILKNEHTVQKAGYKPGSIVILFKNNTDG